MIHVSHNNAFFYNDAFSLSLKKLFLKNSDNCQKSTNAGTSFWIKIGLHAATIFIEKDTPVKAFPFECWEIFYTYFAIFMDE